MGLGITGCDNNPRVVEFVISEKAEGAEGRARKNGDY